MSLHKEKMDDDNEAPLSVMELLKTDQYNNWSFDASIRHLYSLLVPACLVVCATNGFDSSLLNGLQSRKFHAKRLLGNEDLQ